MDALDTELLRTLIAFADSGSLARAAETVGRSPSAVTAQMQRLEAQIGQPVLEAAGRNRALTPAGEELVDHARRILTAHRNALLSLKGARADGRVSLGSTQDFADKALPALLRDFARTHPRVRLDLRIGRSAELATVFDQGIVDLVIAMRQAPASNEYAVLREPMIWLCGHDSLIADAAELPLAMLDAPCRFRSAMIDAIERTGRPYRIAATSPSLSGVLAAVRSGIAVTARTAHSLEPGLQRAPRSLALPKLPQAEFGLRMRANAGPAVLDLATLLTEGLRVAQRT